ncbi:RNA polymerase sigma factor [Mucilaginibacter sp.]|uniref:RNA polymerase sigma factor n=1 Tax=Mucilaginibacter sp. TaxID=1882438 RepID=UPI002ED044D8
MKVRKIYDEIELLAKLSKGDQQAFRVIFDLYRDKVYSYALKIMKSENAAEEIVSDVFLNIWVNREGAGAIVNFGGYLRTVTRNYALTALRQLARETRAFNIKNQDWEDVDAGTENYIRYKDVQDVVNRALETLPPQQKLVYKLCKLDGMKHADVASQLNISVLTVKTHLKVASQSVKTYMRNHSDVGMLLVFVSVSQIITK